MKKSNSPRNNQIKIVRFPELKEMTSLSRTTIWRLEREGKFPNRITIGDRGVGWILNEIESWLNSCPRCELKANL